MMKSKRRNKSELRLRVEKFLKESVDMVTKDASLKYKPLLYMAFGQFQRQINKIDDKQLLDLLKDVLSKKEQIYQYLNDIREGKEEVKKDIKDEQLLSVLPYVQQLLKDDNNVLKKIIDKFYNEFSDIK